MDAVWTSSSDTEAPMKRMLLRLVVAGGLVALGWTAGQAAQTPTADFEISVSSPEGETTITCRRGCGLQFIRMAPDRNAAESSFTYRCSGAPRCGGGVQGWVSR
jgi:hypothetical protein